MTPLPRLLTVLAAATLLGAGGTVALAQPPQGGGGQQQPDLAAILHLRPDQMGAFHAFQAASQPTPDERSRLRGPSPQAIGAMATPQRLEIIGTLLSTRAEVFHRTAGAIRAFYGQLSPDQQHTYDRLTAPQVQEHR